MLDDEGNWAGITIELWEKIAAELNLCYQYVPGSLEEILNGIQQDKLQVGAAAFSITSEREHIVDFSHSFFNTGLGIAVPSRPGSAWWRTLRIFLSLQFLQILAALTILLFIIGFFIWLFEKKQNNEQFGGKHLKGIGAGLWWSAVTMTTVGYGDKTPVTVGGRIIALIWMFTGIIIISTFTAAITSTLTVAAIDYGISGPQDLYRVKTGTVYNTTSADYFSDRGMRPQLFDSVNDALIALAEGEIEALVYDEPILTYLINRQYSGKLSVLPHTFEKQQYGIALQINSPLRQEINRILLSLIESGEFNRIKRRYLGE
ncbi:extracellular solute-binding protein, family 3 [Chitinispirillum alkaliphilum]|nr:extracellular solute-binding protein, family 3 [Chitinispirillum alkaliphilum]